MTHTQNKQVEIRLLDFDGFYYSHSMDRLESVVNSYIDDVDSKDISIKGKSFADITEIDDFVNDNTSYDFKGYAKNYCENLYTYLLKDEIDLIKTDTFLTFKELYSPKFYNYETDQITALIDAELMAKIQNEVLTKHPKEFTAYLKDRFTSYDGFSSNYPNNPAEFSLLDDEITRGVYLQVLRQYYIDDSKLAYDIYDDDHASDYLNINFEIEN